jgi:RNA polymerase sigma factor (TIGR02999 family)
MNSLTQHEITKLLKAWGAGDQTAFNDLMPLVYDELRRMAGGYLRKEGNCHTLQPTALVHEVYLRLAGENGMRCENRSHFFAIAARQMRHVLVELAREHKARKRGGRLERVPLDDVITIVPEPTTDPVDVCWLDEALSKLAEFDPIKSRIVELKFFGGLGFDEVAEATEITPGNARWHWHIAKLWLLKELQLHAEQTGRQNGH